MNYLLGTDIGTSGIKTIMTDLKGNVIAQDLQETDVLTPRPLWAEQWPDVWLEAAKSSIRNTVEKSNVDPEDIKAIAISGLYGGSGVPLDADMRPVRLLSARRHGCHRGKFRGIHSSGRWRD